MTRITVLAGGVGGARFVRGLLSHLARASSRRTDGTDFEVTVVGNTGDDMWLNGLRVCPDLDTIMYTLGGGIDENQGWGRSEDTQRASAEITAYGRGWDWFTLGDLDLGTHIVRTDMLREGFTLTQVTKALCQRWRPGVRLLPMSDQSVETHVRLGRETDHHQAGDLIHFEEWWVRYRAAAAATEFVQVGLEQAIATPEVIEAIDTADAIVLPPSNPVVSVGTILAVPGVREALRRTPAQVVGLSPIIGGTAVRGMAEQCLATIGIDATALGVAGFYGARSRGGVLDGWLMDDVDAEYLPALESQGIRGATAPLWMSDIDATATMASRVLAMASSALAP